MPANLDGPIGVPSLDRLCSAAGALADEADLDLVVLFGSAARSLESGLNEPASGLVNDLDVGVSAAHGAPDLVALTTRLVEMLGVQAVDVVDLRRADALLLALAARDGVPLHERERGAFAAFASLASRRFADTRKFRLAERDEIREFVARSREAR